MARASEAGVRGVTRCLGELVKAACAALLVLVAPLAAQLPDAEAAFQRGDYRAARAAYERVLVADPTNVRSLYQLAILDSWDGKLARSLERFGRLRRLAPRDGDIMVAQARVLAWADRTAAAGALYDSVLARTPDRTDALAGRARTVAWSGDLDRAEGLWREALARHPDEPELLIGLAQTLYWKGQPALAEGYAARARALAPQDRTVLELERELRAAVRPGVRTTVDGAGDSDGNSFVAQEAYYEASLSTAVRGTLRAGWRRASFQAIGGASYGVGGQVSAPLGAKAAVQAGLGVRRLQPDSGGGTTPLTAALGLRFRPARDVAAAIGYSRSPFDDTAALIESGFVVDALDWSVDISPSPRWSVSAGGGGAWLSDGSRNRRYSAVAAVLARVAPGIQVGPFARVMGYRWSGALGYFAPNRFAVLEGRVTADWRRARWGARADGGVGSQQVSMGAAHQLEWHLGVTLTRGWGASNEIALVGLVTNSAAAAAIGKTSTAGFSYRTLGLRFQQGL
jgi:tetratricopeptide (TPR) repeat protein